jgi:hypothetical protein
MTNKEKIILNYQTAADGYSDQLQKVERILLYLSILRLISFLAGLALILLFFRASLLPGILAATITIIIFLYLLKMYSEHTLRKEFIENLIIINSNEAAAMSGNLTAFPEGGEYIDPDHDFSNDVDIFGNSSLFQYINRTVTVLGRDKLASWLSDPYPEAAHLASRQAVIKELELKEKWRHEFMAHGMNKPLEKSHIAELYNWINEKSLIGSSSIIRLLIYFLPFLTISSLALLIAGIIHYSVFTFFFLLNLFFLTVYLKKINDIHNVLTKKHNYLSSVSRLLGVFNNERFESEILNEIKKNLSGSEISAAVAVQKLNTLIQAFDSRMNILVSFALNGLLLWDFHTVLRLEKWKRLYGKNFPKWLEMTGEADAFISLANFSANNPEFTFPEVSKDTILFSAREMGHPLIDGKERVDNDFEISGAGIITVVTGANMAGKSTFLRTVAVNYILAMTGAPVCASSMSFTPLKLFTSMRTTDSLSHNESYFYAELKRLKLLKQKIENHEPVLFILDEILKGTNSADKSLGSHLFLKRLVELSGTGFIATHDISVGEMEKEFPESIVNQCFEIEIEGDQIIFDYKLRQGIAFRMNAALLMKQMGILE